MCVCVLGGGGGGGGGGVGGGNQNKYLHLVIYRICFRKKEAWIINNVVNVL